MERSASIFILLYFLAFQALGSQRYSLADLEVLSKDKASKEFLDHAMDILPSKRTKHWRSLVQDNSEKWIDKLLFQKKITYAHFQYIESLADWPALKRHEFFLQKRRFFLKSYLLKGPGTLAQKIRIAMQAFYSTSSGLQKSSLALMIYHLYHQQLSYTQKSTLMTTSLSLTSQSFLCQQKLLAPFIFEFLRENQQKKSTLLSKDCWKLFKKNLTQGMSSSKHTIRETSYHWLTKNKMISSEDIDIYLSLFLIHGPVIGETFNRAWRRLSILGQDYERRKKVINRLQKLDPLPDGLLTGHDQKKKKTVLAHFAKNFPEYWDYYAQSCIDYYQGKEKFKNGNPTLYCKELFHLSSKLSIPHAGLKKKFRSLSIL